MAGQTQVSNAYSIGAPTNKANANENAKMKITMASSSMLDLDQPGLDQPGVPDRKMAT